MHAGCNVENAAYPEGNCAEANAIGAMVSSGGKKISVIAAVGGSDELEYCTPCGGCRQSILEFSDENTRILLLDEEGHIQKFSIDDLLPLAFRLRQARL
jgi:cytidine deaminase